MKLSIDSIEKLEALLTAASLVKIDNVIIEEGKIRGIDNDKSVVVISEDNVPDFGKYRIGLNRLDDLAKRISLSKNNKKFEIDAEESQNRPGDISHLKLNSDKTKSQFRTANPDNIKAPKGLNDEQTWLVVVPQEDVSSVVQAAATMGSEEIIISCKSSGEVSFEFIDETTQDTFSHKFASEAQYIPTDASGKGVGSFVHYYRSKSFLPLLRSAGQNSDVPLIIGKKGMLWITVKGYSFTIIPRVGGK